TSWRPSWASTASRRRSRASASPSLRSWRSWHRRSSPPPRTRNSNEGVDAPIRPAALADRPAGPLRQGRSSRMGRVTLALAAALALLAVAVPVAAAAPKAGPKVAKCGKLKKKAAKKRCQKQNQANRIAFNQIKNGTFTGYRGDGELVEETFCANGRYRSVTEGAYGRGTSTGRSWRGKNART